MKLYAASIPLAGCPDGMCGGCPRCGCSDLKPTDEDLEDQAMQQIDAEADL